MPHRYFTRELADGRAALTGSDAHHLADVMRAKLGEEVVLCGAWGASALRPSAAKAKKTGCSSLFISIEPDFSKHSARLTVGLHREYRGGDAPYTGGKS